MEMPLNGNSWTSLSEIREAGAGEPGKELNGGLWDHGEETEAVSAAYPVHVLSSPYQD